MLVGVPNATHGIFLIAEILSVYFVKIDQKFIRGCEMELKVFTSGQEDSRGGFAPMIHFLGEEFLVDKNSFDSRASAEEAATNYLRSHFKTMLGIK